MKDEIASQTRIRVRSDATTPSCWTCFSILPLRHAELVSASQVLNTRLWNVEGEKGDPEINSGWRYYPVMLNSIQHPPTPSCWTWFSISGFKNETLKRVQGDVKVNTRPWNKFRVTLLPCHAELDSASSYLVMLNLIQHLKHETLKRVQGDA